jgi:predicted aspartyl protease
MRNDCWLVILLTLSVAACAPQQPVATPAKNLQTDTPTVPTPVQSAAQQNDREIYQQALTKADAANAIGQSAQSQDDWFLAAHNLQASVEMLKSIPPTSSQYALAAKVLPLYEQKLASAKTKASNFLGTPTPASVIASPAATAVSTDSFSIPIQQKLGGVPVVEVTLVTGKESYQVPMLFDTGASHTMITQATADRLKIKGNGGSQATTANGIATFKRAPIESIKFGNGETKQVQVAIAQGGGLNYGLLGQDVYAGYDITIKLNSIEFRKR